MGKRRMVAVVEPSDILFHLDFAALKKFLCQRWKKLIIWYACILHVCLNAIYLSLRSNLLSPSSSQSLWLNTPTTCQKKIPLGWLEVTLSEHALYSCIHEVCGSNLSYGKFQIGYMFSLPAGRSGVLVTLNKNAQILKILSRQKWSLYKKSVN